MEKPLNSSPKQLNKHSKNRKKQQQQQPLKVVYITNPIKIKATASEFRALVQELTGQGAVYPPEYAGFAVGGGVDASPDQESTDVSAGGASESDNAHAVVGGTALTEEWKLGRERECGSDPPEIGSGTDDGFYSGEMVENLQGMSLIHDVLKCFDGI